jgi:RNA polymerase sigma-70 factor, ECF subfamily
MAISIDDRLLVESHRAGDRAAFEAIVRVHQPALMAHALRSLHDRAAAEDAVQETLLRAYRALPRFDGEYKVGPWLHRILANVCVDEANRRRREGEKFDRAAVETHAAELVEPGVEDALGLDADTTYLRDALAGLSPTYQEALLLRFVDGLPYDEVARTTGVTEENARARVSRARSAMRTVLRGVAAVPVLAFGALRRGEQAAAALESPAAAGGGAATTIGPGSGIAAQAAPSAPSVAHGAGMAAQAGPSAAHGAGFAVQAAPAVQAASAFAPAVDVAHAVAVAAPTAMPMLTKAAIGLTMAAAVAVPTAGPALLQRDPAPPVAAAPAAEPSAPAAASAVASTPTTAAVAAAPAVSTTTPIDDTVAAPPTTAAPALPVAPLPAAPAADAPAAPAPGAPVAEPAPAAPIEVAPVVVRSAGSLSVSGLVVTPAGPRLDLAGPATLTVGGSSFSGSLSGRISVADAAPGEPRRLEGTLVVRLADGSLVEVRLAGFAAPATADGPATGIPGASSLTGSFRATSADDVALLASGSFTGALDPATGVLTLALG